MPNAPTVCEIVIAAPRNFRSICTRKLSDIASSDRGRPVFGPNGELEHIALARAIGARYD
jgi:hypothetical protein